MTVEQAIIRASSLSAAKGMDYAIADHRGRLRVCPLVMLMRRPEPNRWVLLEVIWS